MRSMKRWLKIVGLIVCAGVSLAVSLVGYQLWDFSRPAVSARRLARLNTQMDTNSVAKLLGTPTTSDVFTNDEGRILTTWTYSRPSGWKFITICFDADGKFQRHFED